MKNLLPIYLRKETADFKTGGDTFRIQVVAYYRDAEATKRIGLNSYAYRPNRRFKSVMLNCCRWRVVWLDDAT
jgi:hypothetical protein